MVEKGRYRSVCLNWCMFCSIQTLVTHMTEYCRMSGDAMAMQQHSYEQICRLCEWIDFLSPCPQAEDTVQTYCIVPSK